jgi:hypothetical protein
MLIQATAMVCSMIFFWDSARPWSASAKRRNGLTGVEYSLPNLITIFWGKGLR